MSSRFKQMAFALKIVNLAVVNNSDALIGALHRLVAASGSINNCETSHAKRDVAILQHTLIIRAAMVHHADHCADRLEVFTAAPDSADATHRSLSPLARLAPCENRGH